MLVQARLKDADPPQLHGSEALVTEPPVKPPHQHARVGYGDARIAGHDDKRAVARADGFRDAEVGVASQCGEPGHLGFDGLRGMHLGSIDPQHIRPTVGLDAERRVVLVTQEPQPRVLHTECGQARAPKAPQPKELNAPTQRLPAAVRSAQVGQSTRGTSGCIVAAHPGPRYRCPSKASRIPTSATETRAAFAGK